MGDASIRSSAGLDIMQWEAIARTLRAPFSIISEAALVIVPAVSTISSIKIMSISFTSPIICISPTTLARLRVLLQSTIGQSRYFA